MNWYRTVRAGGEAFDADQSEMPCSDCGLGQYTCECDLDAEPLCLVCEEALREDGFCEGCDEPSEEARVARILARFAKRVPLTDVELGPKGLWL